MSRSATSSSGPGCCKAIVAPLRLETGLAASDPSSLSLYSIVIFSAFCRVCDRMQVSFGLHFQPVQRAGGFEGLELTEQIHHYLLVAGEVGSISRPGVPCSARFLRAPLAMQAIHHSGIMHRVGSSFWPSCTVSRLGRVGHTHTHALASQQVDGRVHAALARVIVIVRSGVIGSRGPRPALRAIISAGSAATPASRQARSPPAGGRAPATPAVGGRHC